MHPAEPAQWGWVDLLSKPGRWRLQLPRIYCGKERSRTVGERDCTDAETHRTPGTDSLMASAIVLEVIS